MHCIDGLLLHNEPPLNTQFVISHSLPGLAVSVALSGSSGSLVWLHAAGRSVGARPAGLLSSGCLASSKRLNQASLLGSSSIQEAWQSLLQHLSGLCMCYTC